MKRAWTRLPSGARLDLINPSPLGWTHSDLVIRLSRTFRWSGESIWPNSLSVAQHSLTVLALRQQFSNYTLTPGEALRELLHDGEEGFLGFDAISPLKSEFGDPFAKISSRLMQAIETRYRLPAWTNESYLIHKQADNIAAAAEAVHCAGWSVDEARDVLELRHVPINVDPLAEAFGCNPWEPWEPRLAEDRFMAELTGILEERPTALFRPVRLLQQDTPFIDTEETRLMSLVG